jgi:predicted DNA-binding transcriptional regulator AlpA
MPIKAVPAPTTESSDAPDLGLLTPRQLAKELGVSLRSLQRYHDARVGPPRVKLGKHVLYRRAAVNQWLARSEGYTPARPAPKLRKPVVSVGHTRNARRAHTAA